eukprot:12914168-Prorocentrum_lima.AAC.1
MLLVAGTIPRRTWCISLTDKVELPGACEGLLIDIGAFDNLMGDQWLKRVTKYATDAGKTTFVEDQPGRNSVCG